MNKRAHCIIFNNDKGFLILLKKKEKKGIYHQILSGGVENEESFIETIIREIKEEINITISKDRLELLFKENNRAFYYLNVNNLEVNNLRLSNEHIGYGFVKNINLVPELTINQSAGEVSEILKKIITTKFI
tara:strand:+ start:1382 stop:1777 length:396 start_codon:yes stop_codon:yes gene_type:complete